MKTAMSCNRLLYNDGMSAGCFKLVDLVYLSSLFQFWQYLTKTVNLFFKIASQKLRHLNKAQVVEHLLRMREATGTVYRILQISLYQYVFHCYIALKFSAISFQERNQDSSKGPGHTVSKRGFSPDFDVVFTTCCRLFA